MRPRSATRRPPCPGLSRVMPQLAAALTLDEMGEKVGSLSMMHDAIVRAGDALLSGT